MVYSASVSVSTISGHSKVTLPDEEARKAPFPPDTKVLCFDDNGFRVGVVKNVLVFISLHEEASYGTYYEIEIKGANIQPGKTSVYTASDLRLTPDCPVSVSPDYFGSVFKNVESNGSIDGIVLGSFEIPPSMCSNCADMDCNSQKGGKFFYSVRVKFPGMDEAVEAHGVPPEYITVLANGGTISNSLSFTSNSILIGGGSYGDGAVNGIDHHDTMRNRKTKGMKPRRVAPENIQREEDFDNARVREGCYQDQYENDIFNQPYQENIRPPTTIHNIIANEESHFYEDTGSDSDMDKQHAVRKSRSSSRQRDSSRSRPTSNRSLSRTRSYMTSQSPRKVKPQNVSRDIDSLAQNYSEFKETRSHNNNYSHIISSSNAAPIDYRDNDCYNDRANDSPSENSSEEEYDMATFDGSNKSGNDNGYACDPKSNHYDTDEYLQSSQNSKNVTSGYQSLQFPANHNNHLPSNAESRNSTPSRQKAFGKSWSPSNQLEEGSVKSDVKENNNIGKLHVGARASTPSKIRAISSKPSAASDSAPYAHSESRLHDSIPEEGCYLTFDPASGGRFVTQFSHTVIEDAIGFWAPGEEKKIQGFKFKQNQGRSDLMKGIAGKDYKKKYFTGWCQFVKAAKSYYGYLVKYPDNERIEVDIYVFFHDGCAIEKVEDGKLFDVSSVDAVACVAKGNNQFEGVKTGEYGTFLNKGAAAGASLAI